MNPKCVRLLLRFFVFSVVCSQTIEPAFSEEYKAILNDVASDFVSTLGCDALSDLNVGVLPIEADEIGLSSNEADKIYENFLASLIISADGCFSIIDARAAFKTLEYLGHVGGFAEHGQSQLRRIRKSLSNVNYVAQIDVLPERDEKSPVIFKLTNFETGEAIFRATRKLSFETKPNLCAGESDNIPQVVEKTVRKIESDYKDRVILFDGVYAENTNLRTRLGLKLQRQILVSAALVDEKIEFVETLHLERDRQKFDSVSLSSIKNSLNADEFRSDFMSGTTPKLVVRYGNCSADRSDVWLKFFVNDQVVTHFVVSDTDWDRTNDDTPIYLDNAKNYKENDRLRTFGLSISSNFGPNPAVEVGDVLKLSIQVEKNSWVFCFYIQSDGFGIQLFPNKFTDPEKRSFISAGQVAKIPNQSDLKFPDKFNLQISDDSLGMEAVTCYALADAPSNELPEYVRGNAFDLIEPRKVRNLINIFEKASNFPVEKKSLTLSVFPEGSLQR